MAVTEGPLSKWTNVMKGWQYRWFVLDSISGILSYYTSKEKMVKGTRRGCVRLSGAIIGIDDEDDSTFTITVDQKTFHFQARDSDERERWITALERAIEKQLSSASQKSHHLITPEQFEHKLMETDAYLQLLIEQNETVQRRINGCEDVATKENYSVINVTADAMIDAIKHAIVMLQIAKKGFQKKMESVKEPVLNGTANEPALTEDANFDHFKPPEAEDELLAVSVGHSSYGKAAAEDDESLENFPTTSYSSSDDDEFYDAEAPKSTVEKQESVAPPVIAAEDDCFDDLYDVQDEEDLGSMEKHGSMIGHLLSQVRIGMDLTKVVLPTFILERRSLLEMFADFFAHPDFFCKIAEMPTPKDRMVQVVRWYLSAFHAGRPSEIAKKPYNPILGETFECYWNLPGAPACDEVNKEGPIPTASKENLCFVAEQVSHHPPISAFYAEHQNKKISLDGYIWTKSKFLGLSIGVHMIGQAVISVIDHEEEYIFNFPNGYGRSILTVPWVELGGKIQISCAKTGFSANIEFHTKPFYGGKKNRVTAQIFDPSERKPFVAIEGEWNGVMYAKYNTGMNEAFVDTKSIPIFKKRVKPLDQQGEFESRRLWKEVTYNLKAKNIEAATEQKHALEQRQREEAKQRKDEGIKWETKNFHEEGEHWVYNRPLLKRLGMPGASDSNLTE
ncbi:oxysterol-binding protein-related protein 9-like isoform X2 [Babylonia areolata]|uniref:oxysterol-binding protein-related protein 9-like isoform X2 n=1 Tax=Babylonia areolata TaxID=304850 RepID=UPI003FD2000B